jgi:cytochrome c oxidase cbb3-type subunit II
MNNGPLLFLGMFLAVAFSWTGIVLTNLVQQKGAGADRPYFDPAAETQAPLPPSGEARQGALVYQQLGCFYCHSQQVRNPLTGGADAAPDVARGWGERPSVARDYIFDGRVMLGTMRTGPDLRNVGARNPQADWHYRHLFNPVLTSPDSIMPPFAFLFDAREIKGQPSRKAISGLGEYGPPPGYEVVPTPRAEALVAYLLSLRTSNDVQLPENAGAGAGGDK